MIYDIIDIIGSTLHAYKECEFKYNLCTHPYLDPHIKYESHKGLGSVFWEFDFSYFTSCLVKMSLITMYLSNVSNMSYMSHKNVLLFFICIMSLLLCTESIL